MGKQGPCCHCGVTTTPLWRNGPSHKQVLCNACGTRWRTKGTLENYAPIHSRELIDSEEFKVSKIKCTNFKPKDKKTLKIKQSYHAANNERQMPCSDQNFWKVLGDTSNRSSSGSAASYSESCTHFGATETSDLTGSAQSNVWDSQVPSKKRTCITGANLTPVQMLTRNLHTIMHEQQSSYFSTQSDLLYEDETHTGSFEIGNGSVLLKYPNPKVTEEESEASSFPLDKNSCIINDTYSGSASISESKLKRSTAQVAQALANRDKSYTESLHYVQDTNSPLGFIDLKDVVNFEVFKKYMTDEEQKRLMRYLASTDIDTDREPKSLEAMFNSGQFEKTLSYFQQLLQEGIFETSIMESGFKEIKTLKRLVLHNLSSSVLVEHYQKLKVVKNKQNNGGTEVVMSSDYFGCSKLAPLKRARGSTGQKGTMRSPKRVARSIDIGGINTGSINYDAQEFVDNENNCLSPRSIFALPPEKSSMMCAFHFTDDNNSSNHDLLLQNNNFSNNINSESELIPLADGEESRSSFLDFSFSSQKPKDQ